MTDPFHRPITMGQGTFIETLSIATKEFGYRAEVDLFPDGVDPVEEVGTSAVARVALKRAEVERDDLFRQITVRFTNRRPYGGPPLTKDEMAILRASYDDTGEFPLEFVADAETLAGLADVMAEGMKIETFLERTHAETVEMMRFNEQEVAKYRDGFGYAHLGVTGMSRFFAERLAGRSKAFSKSFRDKVVKTSYKMTHTARAVGVLFSPGNTRHDQVETGRRFARVFLTAARLGLSLHPMMQVTQEYEELAGVRESLTEIIRSIKPGYALPTAEMTSGAPTLQMLFRMGRAKSTPHTPRRDLGDLLRA